MAAAAKLRADRERGIQPPSLPPPPFWRGQLFGIAGEAARKTLIDAAGLLFSARSKAELLDALRLHMFEVPFDSCSSSFQLPSQKPRPQTPRRGTAFRPGRRQLPSHAWEPGRPGGADPPSSRAAAQDGRIRRLATL